MLQMLPELEVLTQDLCVFMYVSIWHISGPFASVLLCELRCQTDMHGAAAAAALAATRLRPTSYLLLSKPPQSIANKTQLTN